MTAERLALTLLGAVPAFAVWAVPLGLPRQYWRYWGLRDAPAVIRQRAPRLAAWFAARGESLPPRIDRVYVTAKAERELGYAPAHDVDAFVAREAT